MIVSDQMTRKEALNQLALPLYAPDELESDILYFCKKLQISHPEFDEVMAAPVHHYSEFPNWDGKYRFFKRVQTAIGNLTGNRLNIYS
jgi:hypothetical protein